ncbi:RHS repeat-associated core domain-containing protein [Streptomyces sp. OV198]|uniref:RHS repeat-associated core domain-containing protein n=1 Tax=Streptomyces sp. OV198 TaxID=1882787 RepID=UPI000BDBEFE0|nr:RHS repeat-associated core domain-containing protein [Streptomyces sp. OV198]SOE77640.1 RHS repeat-associated core domain-containing protein [Streptomyces sp. OV198]
MEQTASVDGTDKTRVLYLFGGAEQLTLDVAAKTCAALRYYAGPDGTRVTRSSSGSVSYQVATSQGTATTAVDASTFAVTRRFYDPYGNARGTSPSSWVSADENHGYLGKPADSVTGLDLLGARNYDPALGRFLTPDPVFESGDPNQMGGYSYAGDNPATQSDPSGLCPKDICDGYGQNTGKTSSNSGGDTATSSGDTSGGSGTSGAAPTPSPSPGAAPTPGPYPPAPHNFVTDVVVSLVKTAYDLVNCEFWLSGGGADHDASCQTASGVVSGGGLEGGGLGAAERGVVGDAEGAAEGVLEGDAAAAAGAGAKAVDEAASDVADLAALKRANAQARAEQADAAAAPSAPAKGASGTKPEAPRGPTSRGEAGQKSRPSYAHTEAPPAN